MNTTLTQDVVIPRCTTPEHEIKSNLSTPAATGPDEHSLKPHNSEDLNSSNLAITKDLHSTAGTDNHSTAGMGDKLVQQLQAQISKKQNNAQENTIFDKFLDTI